MQTNPNIPLLDLDHEHDDLSVVLQDLHVLVEQIQRSELRTHALASARRLLGYFSRDMRDHFEHEEILLFPILREYLSDQDKTITGLSEAHLDFEVSFESIAAMINAREPTTASLQTCAERISALIKLFEGHSGIERKLLRELDQAVTDPVARVRLRKKLSEM